MSAEHKALCERLRLFSDGGKYPIADEAATALESSRSEGRREGLEEAMAVGRARAERVGHRALPMNTWEVCEAAIRAKIKEAG